MTEDVQSQAKLQNMFSIPLLTVQCSNWDQKKKDLLALMKDVSVDGLIKTDFMKQNIKDEWPNNKKFQKIFADELGALCSTFGFISASIHSSWFEQSEFAMCHPIHNHGAYGYSAVCYLNFDPAHHTSTKFVAPFFNFLNGNVLHHEITDAKEGMIVFFPSSIPHYTDPNKSQKTRTIASFNLSLRV